MIVTQLEALNDTERDVTSETWRSRRIVLAREGVGFSMHDTVIYAGTTSTFHYENHIEAVYCVEGEGTLTNEETGEVHPLRDGTPYLPDGQAKHTAHATTHTPATPLHGLVPPPPRIPVSSPAYAMAPYICLTPMKNTPCVQPPSCEWLVYSTRRSPGVKPTTPQASTRWSPKTAPTVRCQPRLVSVNKLKLPASPVQPGAKSSCRR